MIVAGGQAGNSSGNDCKHKNPKSQTKGSEQKGEKENGIGTRKKFCARASVTKQYPSSPSKYTRRKP